MVKIVLEINEALLSKALISSQEQGMDLNTFLCEALDTAIVSKAPEPESLVLTTDDLIAKVVDRARTKEVGVEFMLVDLCTTDEWESLSSGERKSFGKSFRRAVEDVTPPVAKYVRRTSSNKAVYERV